MVEAVLLLQLDVERVRGFAAVAEALRVVHRGPRLCAGVEATCVVYRKSVHFDVVDRQFQFLERVEAVLAVCNLQLFIDQYRQPFAIPRKQLEYCYQSLNVGLVDPAIRSHEGELFVVLCGLYCSLHGGEFRSVAALHNIHFLKNDHDSTKEWQSKQVALYSSSGKETKDGSMLELPQDDQKVGG